MNGNTDTVDTASGQAGIDYKELARDLRHQLIVDPKPSETEAALAKTLHAAESAPRREDRACFCQILSLYYLNFADVSQAERWLDEADRLSEGLTHLQAGNAYVRATFYTRQRRAKEALEVMEPFIDKVDPEVDLPLAARFRTLYAGMLDATGKVTEADEAFRVAIELRERLGSKAGLAIVYYNYAEFLAQRDDELRALDYFQRSLSIEKELGLNAGLAQSASHISLLYARQGERAKAEDYYQMARTAAEACGVPSIIAIVKANAASLYERLDDETKQLNALLDAKTYLDRHPFDAIKGPVLGNLAELYIRHERFDEAESLLDKATSIADREGSMYNIGHWLYVRGVLRHKQGKLEDAAELLHKAIVILSDVKAHVVTLQAFAELATVQSKMGLTSEAARSMAEWASAYIKEHDHDVRERLKTLQEVQERDRKQKEDEIYRLKNFELSNALEQLKVVNTELRDLAAEKDDFMAIAAHDLRNPLADMRNMLQTMLNHYDVLGKDDVLDVARDLLATTTRMSATVHAFLEVSRTDRRSAGVREEILDMVHLAHRAMERHTSRAEFKNIKLSVDAHDHVWAHGDASIVDAVMDNLISNAVKFSPKDSTVSIRTFIEGDRAIMRVSDQGSGIKESERPLLFTKYSRLSNRPTGGEDSLGLGLYLSRRMAERIDATLEYKVLEGEGATFDLSLKLAQPS